MTEIQKIFSPPWHLFRQSDFENRSTQLKVTSGPQNWGLGLGSGGSILIFINLRILNKGQKALKLKFHLKFCPKNAFLGKNWYIYNYAQTLKARFSNIRKKGIFFILSISCPMHWDTSYQKSKKSLGDFFV